MIYILDFCLLRQFNPRVKSNKSNCLVRAAAGPRGGPWLHEHTTPVQDPRGGAASGGARLHKAVAADGSQLGRTRGAPASAGLVTPVIAAGTAASDRS